MHDSVLTGAQRSFLRGLGQRLDPALKLGREGVSAGVTAELDRLLKAHELVKVRFLGADRDERATLCEQVAAAGKALCVGAVGHTTLFYRPNADPAECRIQFPE